MWLHLHLFGITLTLLPSICVSKSECCNKKGWELTWEGKDLLMLYRSKYFHLQAVVKYMIRSVSLYYVSKVGENCVISTKEIWFIHKILLSFTWMWVPPIIYVRNFVKLLKFPFKDINFQVINCVKNITYWGENRSIYYLNIFHFHVHHQI